MTTTTTMLPPKRPSSREDLSAIVRAAAKGGSRVQVSGSNSLPLAQHAENGAPVQPVSMLRLNKVLEHAVSDMTVIVDAGISLEALQRELAWKNQWLPIDPPAVNGRSPGSRTLGGLVATNSLGPLRFGCGDWRLLMLGMRWTDASGTLIRGGGRTVKLSAGYHTPRMMIGSCGTLGVITELTLRTYARPADEQALIVFCHSPAEAEDILGAVLLAPTTPAFVQAIGAQAFASNPLGLPASSIVLAIGYMDRPHVCAAQIALIRGLLPVSRCETISQTAAQSGRLRLWMTSEPAGTLGFRLHVLSSKVAGLIGEIEALAAANGAKAWVVAEAATAVVRGTIQELAAERVAALIGAIEALAVTAGSTLMITHGGPPNRGRRVGPLAAALKATLDPQGVFPPMVAV